jgi:hypothetical protein
MGAFALRRVPWTSSNSGQSNWPEDSTHLWPVILAETVVIHSTRTGL